MYRNYMARGTFGINKYKDDYSYNTRFSDDDLLEIQPYDKDQYIDEDLNNTSNMFFNTMDSFYCQQKELEELDNETDYTINKMNRYYDNESLNFIDEYHKRRKEILDDYSNTIGRHNFLKRINKNIKTEEMDRQLNGAYKNYLGYIEWKRNDEIRKYRNQRAAMYNRKKLEHENFWKQNYNMKYLNYK